MNPHAFFSERNNSQDADSDSDDHAQSPSVDVLWALDAVLAAVPNVKSAAVVPCPILPSADSLLERHRNHLKSTEKTVVSSAMSSAIPQAGMADAEALPAVRRERRAARAGGDDGSGTTD